MNNKTFDNRTSICKRVKTLCVGLLAVFAIPAVAQTNFISIAPTDSPEEIVRKAANVVPAERQFVWQRQELTAFLHFGINTYTGREWGTGRESPQLFNPVRLDADQWVKSLADAGFKCAILTCKHHDGFCLWPSKYTEHSVKNSPWKNGEGDVVREVSEACRRHGIGFGVYLSPWDMNSPIYGTPAYNDFFVHQLTELLTQYGEIDEVWFDGACGEGPNGKKQEYDFERWYKLIRKLQPKAVIAVMGPDVRWVGTETGRGRDTEWSVIPADNLDQASISEHSQKEMLSKPAGDMTREDLGSRAVIAKAKGLVWYPAEVDVSIRPGWYYHEQEDSKVKTPKELMDIYFTSVGCNGVLLLNVPPNKDGLLAEPDVNSLKGFRAALDKAFASNLLSKAKLTAVPRGGNARALTDDNYGTSYAPEKSKSAITFRLDKPVKFNVLCLQEDIRKGQRVERFTLEVKDAQNKWKTIGRGTTIGYKRLLRLPTTEAKVIRLTIDECRLTPHLAEVGVYFVEP